MKNLKQKHCFPDFYLNKLACLLVVVLFSFFGSYSYAQDARVTLNYSNTKLKNILDGIEKQTDYLFIYKNNVDNKINKSISVTNCKVSDVLDELLSGTSIYYKVEGSHIILTKNVQKGGNELTISGQVVDASGTPLIGVNVRTVETSVGTITDIDGRFKLKCNKGNYIVVSYIGYTSKKMQIRDGRDLHIVLKEEATVLNDVVVIGYGTVAKKELTSAVSHVSSKDLLNIGGGNPALQIQGKVSGVMIDNTAAADPNGVTNIQVRGVSSRSAGLGPLVVIDGVPGGSLDNINENDIESIDVLKDGAASAIYGTRGSNGVIVVTMKKGATDGAVHTSYTGYVNITTPIRELKTLSVTDFKKYNRGEDYGAETDWFDEITRVGVAHSHTFQISGGNAKNNYKGVIDFKDSKGIDLRSTRKNIGARLSVNHNSKNSLYSFSLNVAPRVINFNNSDYDVFWMALMANPTMPVMDPAKPNRYYKFTTYNTYNPVETLKLDEKGGEKKILEWDGTFKLNLLPLLGKNNNHVLNTQITLAQQIIDNDSFFYRPSISTHAEQNGYRGEAEKSYDKMKHESLEWLVNYMLDKDSHHLKLMGGYSYQYFVSSGFNAENKDFASDLLSYNNLGAGEYNSAAIGRLGMGSFKEDSKLIAFFGRLSYNLADKYFTTFSLRYEGSSKFGAGNKWGAFPAVSLGWRLSQEKFMKNLTWIDDLKIRGDYGVTGNQDFANYTSLARMKAYDLNYYQGSYIRGWSFSSNPNSNIKWEKGKNWNVGIDFGLFGNRLYGSLNYYSRKQSDLLGVYDVPQPPYGEPSSYVNVGTMKNTGFEVDLNLQVVKTKNFDYNLNVVGSTSNNKFVSFSNDKIQGQSFYWMENFPAYPGDPGPVQRIEEGERIGNFYTYEYAGVDDKGSWLIYSKDGEKIPIKQGSDKDKKVVGNGLPKFIMSMSHSFRYKNVDLMLYFRGNFGFDIYDSHTLYYGLQSAASNTNVLEVAYGKNSHIVEGVNSHNSYFVHKGDYLKLDVLTLGYNWNVNTKWIEKVRLYMTARNLFTIGGYRDALDMDAYAVNGMQPGVPSSKNGYYPSSRQCLFGVQINF